jgi:hypothetical protein
MLLKFLLFGLLTNLLCFAILQPAGAISRTEQVTLTVPETSLTLKGYAAPDSIVTITESGSPIGTTIAGTNGYYEVSLTAQKTGLRKLQAYFEDYTGLRSAVVSRVVSVTSQTETTAEVLLAPTISRRTSEQLIRGSIIQISGYSYAGAQLTLALSNGTSYIAKANSVGLYEFLVDSVDLSQGKYSAKVRVSMPSTEQSTAESLPVIFTVLPTPTSARMPIGEEAPSAPDVVVSPQQLPPPLPQTPNDGDVIDGDSVKITGESVPFAQIIMYENGKVIGSTFADENGKWSFVYTATSSPVTFSFEACFEGRCSVLSKTLTLTFSNFNVCPVDFRLVSYRFWGVTAQESITLQIETDVREGVFEIDWGDGRVERFDYDSEKNTFSQSSYERKGNYNGQVTLSKNNQKNTQECSATRYFSVHVVDPEKSDTFIWQLILLLIAVGGGYSLHSFKDKEKESTTNKQ